MKTKGSKQSIGSAVQVMVFADPKQSAQENQKDFYHAANDLLSQAKCACGQMHTKNVLERMRFVRLYEGNSDPLEQSLYLMAILKAEADMRVSARELGSAIDYFERVVKLDGKVVAS